MTQNGIQPDIVPATPETGVDAQSRLVAALMDRRRYPHAVKSVRCVETHISWILLAGRHAYKIKKAVDLGFLNFVSLASRRHYCEEEIRLNRRLAPEIYLDVVPIGGVLDTPEFGALPAIEYAVRMKRFPASNELDKLAARGKLIPRHMDELAAAVADFHSNLPAVETESASGSAKTIHSTSSRVFDTLNSMLRDNEDVEKIAAIRYASECEYGASEAYFERRHAQGFVRECHGDMHLGNIVLMGGRPVPFDCIEFDPALRWIDVMNDIAFTVMDLLHWKVPGLAYRLLNAYLEATGDYAGVRLLRFYLSYRAMVRAMVNAIRADQTGLSSRARAKALADCRGFLALAAECLARHRPALIITHGLPGSGKTTFSQTALERLQAIRIRSDVERKRLFGLLPLADSRSHPVNIYSMEATRLTYTQLHGLARELLIAGVPVIV
ncbi:MAG TPA: AAA family ATPase, partial [Nitrosospira sp.]